MDFVNLPQLCNDVHCSMSQKWLRSNGTESKKEQNQVSVTSLHGHISHQLDNWNAPKFMANVLSLLWICCIKARTHGWRGNLDLPLGEYRIRISLSLRPRDIPTRYPPSGRLRFSPSTMCSCFYTTDPQKKLHLPQILEHFSCLIEEK